jgi:hypothetical protein
MFLGLGDTCGVYSKLEDGLKRIGVRCEFVNAYPLRDYSRPHRPGRLGRLVEWVGYRRWRAGRGSATRAGWKVVQALATVPLMFWAMMRYDVFVFAGGQSFLNGWDLPLLRWFGKRVIVVFHGSEARPPYINGAYVGTDQPLDPPGCIALTRRIRRWVRWHDAYADVVVTHPAWAHFHTRRVVSFLSVGNPYECPPAPPSAMPGTPCRIVHAPTRPAPKGSPEIEAAIARLRARGHRIDFVKIVGRPPQDVLDALATCDFVVDELYGDTPMAGFATEAASFGKPAVVGMHDRDLLVGTQPADMLPPGVVCHPSELEATIETMVVDREYRERLGREARDFVVRRWSPEAVASRYVRLATGEIPDDWTFDPAAVCYLHGWGLPEPRLAEVVAAVVNTGGVAALGVSDKPALESAFVNLAAGGGAGLRSAELPRVV